LGRNEYDSRQMLQKAIDSLDDAVRACVRGDEKALDVHVWRAAFDLEYLTFILSLSRRDVDDAWKKKEKAEKVEDLKATLVAVQDLLREALKDTSEEEVYRKAWAVRSRILSVQRKLAEIKTESRK